MRKFIISDIHGNGNVYYSIMSYLDNINKKEDITLFINGDLIDRGMESAEILLDLKKRIEDNIFKIVYLGGNHELLMYQIFDKRKKNITVSQYNDWYVNGGWVTDCRLKDILGYNKEKILEVADFISNLKIFHMFDERMLGKNIVLVHAACPINIANDSDIHIKDIRIKDNNYFVNYCVWTREIDPFIPFRCRIGNDNYFSVVGHTPNNDKYGYVYNERENYLNIDGGCSMYVRGDFSYDHVPLVEINDNYFKILTFNNNNEIIFGNYFDGSKSILIDDKELDEDRKYLNKNILIRKLMVFDDNTIGYEY